MHDATPMTVCYFAWEEWEGGGSVRADLRGRSQLVPRGVVRRVWARWKPQRAAVRQETHECLLRLAPSFVRKRCAEARQRDRVRQVHGEERHRRLAKLARDGDVERRAAEPRAARAAERLLDEGDLLVHAVGRVMRGVSCGKPVGATSCVCLLMLRVVV